MRRVAMLLLVAVACTMDTIPTGLQATPPGGGPLVQFDLTALPLPNIPVPNDVATFADPTSRTGRRLNVSLIAPTDLEQDARNGFSEMEGWGTFAPISVSFTRPSDIAPTEAAIDLESVRATMQRDGYDTTDDPVYVVNLSTGVPALLDVNGGSFPRVIQNLQNYYPNDPRVTEQNILLETFEEGAGLAQGNYTPALDTDFDGVLDHPDTLATLLRPGGGTVHGVDDLLDFYERETDTLLLRPVLPLAEKTRYAVVLTDRLKDILGRPVRSPFPFVYHPSQQTDIAVLQTVLADGGRSNYYGDIAGSGLQHVAFAWSFTTAPTTEDMRLLRDGFFGHGPFAHLATDYPPTTSIFRAAGLTTDQTLAGQEPGWQTNPNCQSVQTHPYTVRISDIQSTLTQVLGQVFSLPQDQLNALVASFDSIDHIVIGSYPLAYLIGPDPTQEQPTDRFQLNYQTGQGRFATDMGHFWITVPKAQPAKNFVQPFPTVVWGHGSTLNDAEIVIRAGYFARQGLAMLGFDAPGHGIVFDPGTKLLLQGLLYSSCLVPWSVGLEAGRAYDLNGDGIPDPGGLLWTAHIFHSRDNIRQTVLDGMQAARVLKTFDGRIGNQDYNDDGQLDVLGDFDSDGTPDVGGSANLYSSGDSYGGIFTMIHTVLDPNIVAGGSICGGGGLTDVASRSYGVVDSVVEQLITPLVIAVPASTRPTDGNSTGTATLCSANQMSVRFVINDLTNSREMEFACLDITELASGMTVVVRNPFNGKTRCARTLPDGSFRVAIPASAGDDIQVQIYNAPDVVDSYATCNVAIAPGGRAITTFEQPAAGFTPIGNSTNACSSGNACQQYRDTFYPVGSQLVAPQSGLGLLRQTPDLRKLLQLTQAAVDTADPINFAPLYMLQPNPGPDGTPQGPKPFLTSNTVADGFVVDAAGHAFARAAGVLPFLPASALPRMPDYADYVSPPAIYAELGQETPSDALSDHYVLEGQARLERAPAGPTCGVNYQASSACTDPPPTVDPTVCAQTVFDPDWHAEGRDLYGAQHFPIPLRLARQATTLVVDGNSLVQTWSPRLLGAPLTADGGWVPSGPLLGLMDAYVNPLGQHVWTTSDPCKAWDDAVYYDHALARFLVTGGTDLYYLSHPATHGCMANQSCAFLQ